ncbi:MAG TPA: glycosyltransferase family 39 protein [Planctomycetota bacterium]|nr:glycosyltransferase family 39 protein [Planctomycetota bacterium]
MEAAAARPDRGHSAARWLCAAVALAQLLTHFAVNARGGYGFFRDEFYYLACSRHLAAGYVDLPPLSAFLLALQSALFGTSLFALRLFPALAGAVVVFLTGTLALRLGAGRAGAVIASLGCACSPLVLAFTGFYSMNAFDLLFWVVAVHLFVSALADSRPRTWIALGLVCGLGMLNKIDAGWLVAGIFVGMLATPQRRLLKTPWPWIAASIAALTFTPFVAWNFQHDFAHLEFIHNASSEKYAGLSAWSFIEGQIPAQHPLNVPLWLAGLGFLLFAERGERHRALAWIWLTAFTVLVLHGHSKPEYLTAAYPLLFAAGGAAFDVPQERWFARVVKPMYAALLVVSTIFIVPLVLPVLPVETYIAYAERLGVKPDSAEGKELSKLPQFYADMFGWQAKVDAVARAFSKLTPAERADCAIFASNYGRCGAIDFLGKAHALPDSVGSHNSCWIWGPRQFTGKVMLVLADDLGGREALFESTEVSEHVPHDAYCLPYENDLKVFLCRGLKQPLAELWPQLRHYD